MLACLTERRGFGTMLPSSVVAPVLLCGEGSGAPDLGGPIGMGGATCLSAVQCQSGGAVAAMGTAGGELAMWDVLKGGLLLRVDCSDASSGGSVRAVVLSSGSRREDGQGIEEAVICVAAAGRMLLVSNIRL